MPSPPQSLRLDSAAVFETLVVLLIAAAIVTLIIKRRGRSGVAVSKRSAYIRLLKQAGGDDELGDRILVVTGPNKEGAAHDVPLVGCPEQVVKPRVQELIRIREEREKAKGNAK